MRRDITTLEAQIAQIDLAAAARRAPPRRSDVVGHSAIGAARAQISFARVTHRAPAASTRSRVRSSSLARSPKTGQNGAWRGGVLFLACVVTVAPRTVFFHRALCVSLMTVYTKSESARRELDSHAIHPRAHTGWMLRGEPTGCGPNVGVNPDDAEASSVSYTHLTLPTILLV